MPTEIRFVSKNPFKLEEAATILSAAGVTVSPLRIAIEELQIDDAAVLVKDKTLKAFSRVGRSLFVEHTGLYLSHLSGLPGGLTEVFWNTLEADRFAELFGNSPDTSAVARTIIGYTDARNFYQFTGEISGRIAPQPKGSRMFQWDCVFIPEGETLTFAEMGDRKNELSMRRRALDAFAQFLRSRGSR